MIFFLLNPETTQITYLIEPLKSLSRYFIRTKIPALFQFIFIY